MPPSIMLLQLLWCVGQWNHLTTGGNRGLTAKSKCFFLYSNTGKEWGPYWQICVRLYTLNHGYTYQPDHKNRSGWIHNAQPLNHLSFNLFQLCQSPTTAICDCGLSKCTCKRKRKQEILTTNVNVRKVLYHWIKLQWNKLESISLFIPYKFLP